MEFTPSWIKTLVYMIIFDYAVCDSSTKYRLCVLTKFQNGHTGPCSILNTFSDSQVECVFGTDRLDCLQKVLDGHADFSVFKSEDLLVAPSLIQTNSLMVTNELRLTMNQLYEFDMVAVISNDANITSLADLRGKRLCHPGFDEDGYLDDWSEVFSQYFEEKVVPQSCDQQLSIAENRIQSLHRFFGSSCKPGAWSPNPNIDHLWKHKYRELCDNCHNPVICDRDDLYWGRQGPLHCLSSCQGDVAWVRLQDIHIHFMGNNDVCGNMSSMSFLCPDGSTIPLNDDQPCVWISRPWPVILSSQSVAYQINSLIEYINENPKTFQANTWQYSLRYLIGYTFQAIYSLNPMIGPAEYLNHVPGFTNANNNMSKCETIDSRRINICIENDDELEKCQLMSFVAATFDINPHFGCTYSLNCTEEVIDYYADVFIVKPEHLMAAHRMNKFKAILYESSDQFWKYTSAVVRADSNIYTFEDLKKKNACFTNADGFGWNSFVLHLKNMSLLPENVCPYTNAVLEFFGGNICVIDDSKSELVRSCFPDKFPDEYKFVDSNWNEAMALRCIVDGGGDVAFIDFNSIGEYLNKYQEDRRSSKLNNSHFRQVCPHKDDNPKDCYLAWASFGQVMVNKNITTSREEEITSAFLLLSLLFGNKYVPQQNQLNRLEQIFKLFSPFNNKSNLIFQDQTRRFLTVDEFIVQSRNKKSNFEYRVDKIGQCHAKVVTDHNSSSTISISTISIVVFINIILLSFSFS